VEAESEVVVVDEDEDENADDEPMQCERTLNGYFEAKQRHDRR